MIRLGLIGCGAWGWRYLPASLHAGNCQVVAVARADNAPAEARPYLLGLPHVADWRRMLEMRIDAFVVATPPDSHEYIACELLDHGRPVMVEKPVALDVVAAQRIADAAKDSGAPLLIDHVHLFSPAFEELRRLVAEWTHCGIYSKGGGHGPFRSYSALWDYGSHDVAMALGIMGTNVRVVTATHHPDSHRIVLASGQKNAVICVWRDGHKERTFRVTSSKLESAIYDDQSSPKLRYNDVDVHVPTERPLTRAVRTFADAITTGRTDWRFDPQLGVEVTRILAQAEAMKEAHGDH